MSTSINSTIGNCMAKLIMDSNTEMDPRKKLLCGSICYCIPYVPGFINQILDIPNKMMMNGYELKVKKGDFELRFGRDVSSSEIETFRDELS